MNEFSRGLSGQAGATGMPPTEYREPKAVTITELENGFVIQPSFQHGGTMKWRIAISLADLEVELRKFFGEAS